MEEERALGRVPGVAWSTPAAPSFPFWPSAYPSAKEFVLQINPLSPAWVICVPFTSITVSENRLYFPHTLAFVSSPV